MCASPPTVHAHSLVAAPSVTLKALDAVPPPKFVLSLPPVLSCYAHWPLRAPCMGTQLLGTPGVPSPAVETPDVETQVCRPQMDPEPALPAAPTLFSAPSTLSLCICWECGAGLTKSQNAHQSSPWGRYLLLPRAERTVRCGVQISEIIRVLGPSFLTSG